MIPLSEWIWSSEVDARLALQAAKGDIRNEEYWLNTVANIESGLSPDGEETLTRSVFERWLEMCQANPEEQLNGHPTRQREATYRVLPQPTPI